MANWEVSALKHDEVFGAFFPKKTQLRAFATPFFGCQSGNFHQKNITDYISDHNFKINMTSTMPGWTRDVLIRGLRK
jgi:hypothetical protein